jgi:SAM-dependent methyltransferase
MISSYDAIADLYATDMGQSMPFDDVGCYRGLCQSQSGSALELGCGTGRILLELIAAGIDAIGADRSLPMLRRLRRDAAARGLHPFVLQMDMHAFALHEVFATILLPYSLITYVTDPAAAAHLLAHLRDRLAPGGVIVLDAFVPQAVDSFADFRLDYRRPHGEGVLERHKRIACNADGTHRIQRRYRVRAADSSVPAQEIHTDETIRPYAPAQLAALAADAGLRVDRCLYDYGTRQSADGAHFATLLLRC